MKIAFIVNQFPVLSETFILNQITGLIDRGCRVDIYAQDYPGNVNKIHPDVQKYRLLERTYYLTSPFSVPPTKMFRLLIGSAHIAKNLLKRPKAVLHALNVLKFGRAAASLTLLYQTIPFLNKGPYDIVHAQFGPNGNLAIFLRNGGALSGKIITHFRGYDVSSYVGANGADIYHELFEKGDLFLCVSERMKETLKNLGCNEQKIVVHRSGVNTMQFGFKTRQPQRDGKVRVLTIARLIEKKGVHYGIQAVAKLLKKYPRTSYKIVGDGPLRNDLLGLTENLGVAGNVELIGWKSQEEILQLFEESDILLAPSVTSQNRDQEGIPVVLMEALALGLPVIATQHGGISELVQDGKSGFLVPERDVDTLAERLQLLIEHRELWLEMGRMGRKHVEQYYDVDKLNDQLVRLYHQLIGRERASAAYSRCVRAPDFR